MNSTFEKNNRFSCPRVEIAEYVDGELSSRDELDLEVHFAECGVCSNELNSQKQVLTTLEIVLEEEKESIQLPADFTKIVTANAESNLDGLKTSKEHSHALFIFAMLFLLIAFGFGIEGDTLVFAFNRFSDQFFAVSGFILHLVFTLSLGVSAIFGSLCSKFIFSSSLSLLLIVATFVLAFIALSRMVFRFDHS